MTQSQLELLAPDLEIARFFLDAVGFKKVDINVASSLIDGTVERTIEGASTLSVTVHDQDRALLHSGIFNASIDVKLDGLWWRLVKVSKSENDLPLTFEERGVTYLRSHRGTLKVSRAKQTRAEFAGRLVREVKRHRIRFYAPEQHIKQPIAAVKDQKTRDNNRAGGLDSGADLKIQGHKANREQIKNAETVLDVSNDEDASPKATKALIEACIVESGMKNLTYGDASSQGILQLLTTTARGLGISQRDIEGCVRAFLRKGFWGKGGAIQLARSNPTRSAGWVAQQTQGSAYPDRYDKVGHEADAIIEAYGGVTTGPRRKRYEFSRGKNEDSWTCLGRLADEVQWRRFMVSNTLYFVSDDYLFRSKPRLRIAEDDPAVLSLDFDFDTRKPVAEMTLECRLDRWAAPPGSVVLIHNCGPADGRWLVSSVRRGLFSSTGEITLIQPRPKLLEPAPEMTSGSSTGKDATGQVAKVIDKAKQISAKHMPYVWGGGHGQIGVASGGGFDCSGYVSACLHAGGMLDTVKVSGDLMHWGKPGKGESMTVWASPVHVWIEFYDADVKRADTSPYGSGASGPRVRYTDRPNPKAQGFTPRHWSGT